MRLLILAVGAILSLVSVEPVRAESIVGDLIDTASTTIEIHQRTQKEKEQWSLEKTELIKQRNVLDNDQEDLLATRAELLAMLEQTKVASQELHNKSKPKTKASAAGEIEGLLQNLVERLDARTRAGLPFLLKERNLRIEVLRALLADSQVGVAEKYRRVMEAVLIELEYGRTVEVYQEKIEVQGKSLTANMLRIGSGALFYQSPDGLNVGRYSESTRGWSSLPAKYEQEVGKAFEIARHQRAAEIIDLPVGRVVK